MRWVDGSTDSMDPSLSKLREIVKDRGPWHAAVCGVTKSWTWLSDWTTVKGMSLSEYLQYKLFKELPRWLSGEESACQAGDVGQFLGLEDSLEKEMTTRSGILDWEIQWTEKPTRLQFEGSQKSWIQLSNWTKKSLNMTTKLSGPENYNPKTLQISKNILHLDI